MNYLIWVAPGWAFADGTDTELYCGFISYGMMNDLPVPVFGIARYSFKKKFIKAFKKEAISKSFKKKHINKSFEVE